MDTLERDLNRALLRSNIPAVELNAVDLPEEAKRDYSILRTLPDGRIIGVHRLLYHWSLHIDLDWAGYADKYCYSTLAQALTAITLWDGMGDPPGGWHRHLNSGRRRDPETGEEWIAW